jgi:hypothetical protein
MGEMAEAAATLEAVRATIPYVKAGEKAVFNVMDRASSYWPQERHEVTIRSMRAAPEPFALERNGFLLLRRPTAVTDFSDPEQVDHLYAAEVEALMKRLTGAQSVLVFGQMVRTNRPGTEDGRLPAYGAHLDYGERTVRWFAETHLGRQEAERRLDGRFVLANLWRPIRTVEKTPLALCDASTVAASDLNDSEVRGGLNDPNRPSLWGYNLSYNPAHRWWYAPRMRPDEVLVFKLFDSDRSRVQWTGHTAFDDPTALPDAAPRESIEIRTISFFPA